MFRGRRCVWGRGPACKTRIVVLLVGLTCWSACCDRAQAAGKTRWLELVKTAAGDSAASYGEISVDGATKASMEALLGRPISAKERSCLWIGTEGCRRLDLKMVRASFTEDDLLSHMALDVQHPVTRSAAVEALGLGEPVETRESKEVTIELFPPANVALGLHKAQVIRLYLFGSHTPGMQKKPSMTREQLRKSLQRVAAKVTQKDVDAALRVAVGVGDPVAVAGFLAAGANPMIADSQGETVLHHAAYFGHDNVIAPLVFGYSRRTLAGSEIGERDGPAFNALLDKQDNHGATALHFACLAREVGAAKSLLRIGADPNLADADGQTPLHVAALAGDADLVEALLLARAEIYRRNGRGYYALDLATDKETQRLLTVAAAYVGDDPAKSEVKEVVESFLKATRDGDIAMLKSCVLPAVREEMPDRIEKRDLQWIVMTVEFEPGIAVVRCGLTSSGESSESGPMLARFRLRCTEEGWRIAEVDINTRSTAQQGESP